MQNKLVSLVSFASISLLSTVAMADGPFYVTGAVGGLWRMDSTNSAATFSTSTTTGPGTNTTTYNIGPTVSLGVGYRLPWSLRVEGEVDYAHFTTSSVDPLSTNGAFPALNGSKLSTNSGGEHNRYLATANVFYDIALPGRFIPYVGGGAGYARADGTDAHFTTSNGRTFNENTSTINDPVVLGEAGLTVRLTDSWAVVPAYRFTHIFNSSGSVSENDNIFKLGVRFSF
jgi:opacity protein-like surface antigen